jgi:23S rRNA A1618 N6-methylase RlmF
VEETKSVNQSMASSQNNARKEVWIEELILRKEEDKEVVEESKS